MADTIFFLMGPTASGKTPLAVKLVQAFPCEIISVDSAMVYRDLNIGSAKPDAETLKIAPHRLIDIVDPAEAYSAGQFRTDALREINDVLARGNIPLLVGGTMMYFRILQQGLATLPQADAKLREVLKLRAEREGWEALHAELAHIDSAAAARIHANDAQRIQRALEVYLLTGKTITAWQQEDTNPLSAYQVKAMAIAPNDRAVLHERIEQRFDRMLDEGFVEEVKKLHMRADLSAASTSMRSVGYRQMWQYLSDELNFQDMRTQAIVATRQLAKRQLTWLRSWPGLTWFDSEAADLYDQVSKFITDI